MAKRKLQTVGDFTRMVAEWLGLAGWHVFLAGDRLENNTAAAVTINRTYMRADIAIDEAVLADPERLKIYLTHELLHVALAEMTGVIEQMAAELPEAKRKIFNELATGAEERTIEKMIRGWEKAGNLGIWAGADLQPESGGLDEMVLRL